MSKKILIVDDAAFMRMMIKDILTKNGFEVVGEAADGVQAVEKYNELRPDLVTMDITMPNKDGLQALEEILGFDPDAKIVMCTAIDENERMIKAIEIGAIEYLVKPINEIALIQLLKLVLN